MLNKGLLILSVGVFLAAIWIIVPAPAYNIWLFSVAASEWSLWLGLIAVFIIAGVGVSIFKHDGKLWILSLIFAVATLLISLYPFFSVKQLAQEQNVALSFGEYFSGLTNDAISGQDFTTRTFANVGGQDLQLDVYAPQVKNANNGASVVVIHGGSWNAGNRNDFPQWNQWLANNGFTVFDIDYRLAPQPNYLTATADVKCAVIWIKKHAAEFAVAPNRIALFGRSAGAHLALLAAYSNGDGRLPASCAEDEFDEKVRAVVSFYAPVEMFWAYNHPANELVINGKQKLGDFLGGNPNESDKIREVYDLATPTTHVSADTPPTFLVHGGKDQLVREENMQFLNQKLTKNAVASQMIFIPYAQHGFDYNFHGFGSQIVKPALIEFLHNNTKH